MANNQSHTRIRKSNAAHPLDETLFGMEQFAVTLQRIEYFWTQNGKEDLPNAVCLDARALHNIDFRGIQAFKERLRDAFRAAGRRGADAYARAVYQELTEGRSKYGVEAFITTSAVPNDPNLKPGEYGVFSFIAKNGDKLRIAF